MERSAVWKRALGQLLLVLAVCLGLNFALTLQNAWPSVWVRPGAGLSVELLVLLGIGAVYLERRRAVRPWLAWCLTAVFFFLIVGRYFAVTAHALFGRAINLYFDLPQLPAVISMNAESRSSSEVIFFAAVLVVLPVALLLLIRGGVGVVARALADRRVRRVVLGAAAFGIVVYAGAPLSGLRWAEGLFTHPVSPVYVQQAGFVADALAGPEDAAFLSPSVPPVNPRNLDDADAFVFFLESYGEVAYSVPEIAAAVRPRARQSEGLLRAEGWHMASGYFTSPTFGGASWLAHSSFLTGKVVSDNRAYQLLLSSAHSSLVGGFGKAGYRTVALMPGLKLAWPEGRFYGFDAIYDAAGLAYGGLPFGWWSIPDQFTLGRLLEREVSKPGREPLFVVFPTVMSHMPFTAVPPYLSDWAQAADAAAYADVPVRRDESLGDWKAARASYRRAILYNLDMVEGFLIQRAPPGALVVVLGDHQPPGVISGPGASRLVPVHVFSRDEGRIAKFLATGFGRGFTPKGATLGDFEALHRKFAAGLQ